MDLGGGILRWEDPPPLAESWKVERRPWAIVAAQLRAEPGRWALLDDACTYPAMTARITGGRGWWAPRGSFEACVRAIDGRILLYARYVGHPKGR